MRGDETQKRRRADDAVSSEFHQLLVERGDTGGAVPRGPTHLMPPTTVSGFLQPMPTSATVTGSQQILSKIQYTYAKADVNLDQQRSEHQSFLHICLMCSES